MDPKSSAVPPKPSAVESSAENLHPSHSLRKVVDRLGGRLTTSDEGDERAVKSARVGALKHQVGDAPVEALPSGRAPSREQALGDVHVQRDAGHELAAPERHDTGGGPVAPENVKAINSRHAASSAVEQSTSGGRYRIIPHDLEVRLSAALRAYRDLLRDPLFSAVLDEGALNIAAGVDELLAELGRAAVATVSIEVGHG